MEEVSETHRAWLRSLFVDLATDAGARDPEQLARQLMLLYDGAAVSAWMDHNPSAATAARSVATALVDAALPESAARRRTRIGASRPTEYHALAGPEMNPQQHDNVPIEFMSDSGNVLSGAGGTVRRRPGPRSRAVGELLRYLESVEFPYSRSSLAPTTLETRC